MPRRDTMHLRNSRAILLLIVFLAVNFLSICLATGQQGSPGSTVPASSSGTLSNSQNSPAAPGQPPQQPVTPSPSTPSQTQPTTSEPVTNDNGVFVIRKEVEEVMLHATVV